MFKSILPSRRQSPDFTMVTPPIDSAPNGKENNPEPAVKPSKAATTKGLKKVEPVVTNEAFDKLLDDLQIPSTLRPKLATMDSTVKAAMLKSSQIPMFKPPASPPPTPRTLRKAHSSDSLASPNPVLQYDFPRPPAPFTNHPSKSVLALGITNRIPSSHARGASFDVLQTLGRAEAPPVIPADLSGKSSKDKGIPKDITPSKFCAILSSTSSTQLDIESVKKLRLLLRNESASWSQEFLRLGGYAALLTRLNEILEVEWREEQHDDQMLHELLRCFKALSTSSIGCFALRSSCPTPFVQLISLLYSDKKPGDVATRQLIVELLLILFDLYPPSSLPGTNGRPRREPFSSESAASTSKLITLPAPHKTFYSLIRALLLTPAPPPTESPAAPVSPHAFIESLHRPRIFKTYLQELSDICRDYFWVFCHPNNTVWNLLDTDEGKVEKPRAPGGMTGGVEFEAIGYFTMHLKLLNAIATAAEDLNLPKENEHSAHRLHSDLFLSGIERILLIARKASTTYYPTLHLELARYIALAGRARFELPWTTSRLIGPPPTALCKPGRSAGAQRALAETSMTSGKRAAAGPLPSPRKVEPIKLD